MPKSSHKENAVTSLAGLSDDDFLTITDVAAVLRISYSKAYEVVASGEIAFSRIGTARRVEVRALRAFIEHSRRGGDRRTPNSFINIKKRAG